MGKRGPKAKPTARKKREGTYRKDRDKGKPEALPGMPAPPDILDARARAEWERVAPELYSLGLLSNLERAVLTQYCREWSAYEELAEEVDGLESRYMEVGDNGYKQVRPEIVELRKSAKELRDLGKLLGLDPSSRAGMKGVGTSAPPADPDAAFLFGRRGPQLMDDGKKAKKKKGRAG